MPVSLGTTTIAAIYLGTTSITSAYLGNTQVFGGSFTPLSLFSGGAQGIWLDPSDLSTMFSDRAGTIQVTTPGTVVGKRLDKSGRGNHATAPTDAARPIYGIEPKGGRRNLLLATDTLATQSFTVTAVAHTLAFTGTGTVTLTGASTAGPLVGTGAGNRVSLTFTPTAASLTLTVSGSVTLGQLELGSSATAYQKVVTAYDVTESGVATCHYVQFDGSDDSMSTASIDFTGTNKMSVFAGVRKLSDSGSRVLAELSSVSDTSNGSFGIFAPTSLNSSFDVYVFALRGTSQTAVQISNFPSPTSDVLSVLYDISAATLATETVVRADGTIPSRITSGTTAGTGNFGNWPLFIGRRNNASLPFNGKDYGIVIVGKAATITEITDTETWLAAKTAQVTL